MKRMGSVLLSTLALPVILIAIWFAATRQEVSDFWAAMAGNRGDEG